MQERVRTFLRENDMLCGAAARCLDLASETGEVAKEILRGMDYGKRPYTPTPETAEELGDCLFSLLALCCELDVDAEGALSGALEKYGARLRRNGDAGSRCRRSACSLCGRSPLRCLQSIQRDANQLFAFSAAPC